MSSRLFLPCLLLSLASCFVGCRSPEGSTPAERRAFAREMAATTLEELYREHPEAREELESAPGYAVFSNIKMSTLWTTSGNGYGVAFDQKSGIEYDMRVFLFGGGIGIGLKDFRMVLIFSDTEEFASFVDGGWEFQSDMDVVVKSDDAGAAGSTGGVVDPKITAYRLTEAGVVAGASLAGTRYYLDDSR